MIIDGSYFTGVLSIGVNWDTGADSVTRDAETDNLQSYIDLYERKYLLYTLGESMSRNFINYLLSNSENKVDKWEILKDKLSVKGLSPVANYVYFQYVRRCGIKQTQTGPVYSSGDDRANPNPLLISAWNDMTDMNKSLYVFLKSSKDYDGFHFNNCMVERINSIGI